MLCPSLANDVEALFISFCFFSLFPTNILFLITILLRSLIIVNNALGVVLNLRLVSPLFRSGIRRAQSLSSSLIQYSDLLSVRRRLMLVFSVIVAKIL